LKGQGLPAEQFGKNTKYAVCGDKLCSEVEIDEKKAKEDLILKERIKQKLIEMRKGQPISITDQEFQTKTKEKSILSSGEFLTKYGKVPTAKIIGVTSSAKNVYALNFQVCATNEVSMRAPEVVISSDSEAKNVRLNKIILKDTCAKAVSSIKAIDISSIGVKAIDKTNLNKMIEKNENEFEKLELEISEVTDQIRIKSNLISWQPPDYELAKELNELVSKLSELRKQKDQLKFEYYGLIYKIKLT
ncbi:MAG: hypothetical protein ACE5RI_07510, partial [Candidatus Nitrosomaritimum yanchengensis]